MTGIGITQWFDNNGAPLTNGALYSFQAGTSTQLATYTDSTGTVQNTNPITFGSGGRVQVWLLTGSFYKFVLCKQNDGAFCAAQDILAQVDQVPGGSSGGGSSGCTPSCTGTFISGTASPATSGVLRLASADSVCFRNAAGSTNICLSKDANDLLTWAGGSLKLPEVGAPAGVAGNDILYADNTAHRLKQVSNGGASLQLVNAGQDINTSDFVTQWHFGSTATPLSGTAPTTNQFLQWNGTNIVGTSPPEVVINPSTQIVNTTTRSLGTFGQNFFLPSTHTLLRMHLTYETASVQDVGCTTLEQVSLRDITAATNVATITGQNSVFDVDSGALSVALTAAHVFGFSYTVQSSGCTSAGSVWVTATYQ